MIRAPSEMRCRSMPVNAMTRNTMASTSGIESATTAPARRPRLRKLTAEHDRDRLPERLHELVDGVLDGDRLVRDELGLDADRQVRRDLGHGPLDVLPSASTSPPSRMAMARPMAGSPLTRNMGCGGSA